MKTIVRLFGAIILGFVGLILTVSTLFAIIDPVSSKGADDADPFGNPYYSWQFYFANFAVALACFVTAKHFVKKL